MPYSPIAHNVYIAIKAILRPILALCALGDTLA